MIRKIEFQGLSLLMILILLVTACSQANDKEPEVTEQQDPNASSEEKPTSNTAERKTLYIGIVNAPVTLNQINTQDNSASLAPISLLNDSLENH